MLRFHRAGPHVFVTFPRWLIQLALECAGHAFVGNFVALAKRSELLTLNIAFANPDILCQCQWLAVKDCAAIPLRNGSLTTEEARVQLVRLRQPLDGEELATELVVELEELVHVLSYGEHCACTASLQELVTRTQACASHDSHLCAVLQSTMLAVHGRSLLVLRWRITKQELPLSRSTLRCRVAEKRWPLNPRRLRFLVP